MTLEKLFVSLYFLFRPIVVAVGYVKEEKQDCANNGNNNHVVTRMFD